jgi:hypothetical protein
VKNQGYFLHTTPWGPAEIASDLNLDLERMQYAFDLFTDFDHVFMARLVWQ